MAKILQGGNLDTQALELTGVFLSVTLTHNVAATLKTGRTVRRPYTVCLVDDAGSRAQAPVGFSWALDGNNAPVVTVQLLAGSGVLSCRIWVGYLK